MGRDFGKPALLPLSYPCLEVRLPAACSFVRKQIGRKRPENPTLVKVRTSVRADQGKLSSPAEDRGQWLIGLNPRAENKGIHLRAEGYA